MQGGKTLNAANLEALGAGRLAALLLEISTGDAVIKRRLRLALAGGAGAAEVAREVGKRLASIGKARSFVDASKLKAFVADLEAQRRAILDLVAPSEPYDAFELMWRLVGCGQSAFARTDDSNGQLTGVFEAVVIDLGTLAQAVNAGPEHLAARAFEALRDDSYGVVNLLVPALAPQLGVPGLQQLRQRMLAWQAEPVLVLPEHERRTIGWSSSGKIYEDQVEISHRRNTARFVLQQLADALGDVDGYIAELDERARRTPLSAASIARRLVQAGRPEEALHALDLVGPEYRRENTVEWRQARADTLEALGRNDDAQAFRWQSLVDTLDARDLRSYLRKLPDFEDFDAEQRALAHVSRDGNVHRALNFLIGWPDLARANELVLADSGRLYGDVYELLKPAAEALGVDHPLAATLLRRAMIDFALREVRTSRYKHAARHLRECANLANRISDFRGRPDHPAYEQALRTAHGKKTAFWNDVAAGR